MGNICKPRVPPVKVLDWSEIDDPQDEEFSKYDFPFENLEFEGGGARCVSYAGTVRVLDSAGILGKIKRVAGSSAGAYTATLVALGLSSTEVAQEASVDISKTVVSGGLLQRLVKPANLFRRFGWETGDCFCKFLGDVFEKFTRKDGNPGNPDITFKQDLQLAMMTAGSLLVLGLTTLFCDLRAILYEMNGIELCIVVTNLSQQTEEYCHVKTTPDLPIRKAMRMSMSIPGLFQPVLTDYHGSKDFYVDGSVVCNYPVHCFDGWWLSMKEGDSFFNRLDDLENLSSSLHSSNRFEPLNHNTIGVMLYSDDDVEMFQEKFRESLTHEEREYTSRRPDTKVARAQKEKKDIETIEATEHRQKTRSLIDKFLTSLKEHNTDNNDTISKDELHRALTEASESSLTDTEKKRLFGTEYTVDKLFDQIDTNRDGELSYQEVHAFFINKGFSWLTRSMEKKRAGSVKLADYGAMYLNLIDALGKKAYYKVQDAERSIGVDTDYVNTTDFKLEDEDRIFLFKQGAAGARAFLRSYIANNKLAPVSESVHRAKHNRRHSPFTQRLVGRDNHAQQAESECTYL